MNDKLTAAAFATLCTDLSRKAASDCSRSLRTTLDLAMMAAGPSAVTSIMLHVVGTNMRSLATCMTVARDQERGIDPRSNDEISVDDFLYCCLFIAAGFMAGTNTAALPMIANAMFRRVTGDEPDLPAAWKSVSGEAITEGETT